MGSSKTYKGGSIQGSSLPRVGMADTKKGNNAKGGKNSSYGGKKGGKKDMSY